MKYLLTILVMLGISNSPADHQLSDEEIKAVVDTHNVWRDQVGVPPLTWSDELAEVAAGWAKVLKKKGCRLQHSKLSYGENLFSGTSGYFDATYVVNEWGGEKKFYNYRQNKCKSGEMCGHYTQMVWRSTTKVGCAKIRCRDMDIWVCEYDPPGNWVGEKPY